MLIAIDAGNTNIVFAVWDGETFARSWRCKTEGGRTADEYAAWLYQLFETAGLSFSDIGAAIISSVVPDANYNLRALCETSFHCRAMLVGSDPLTLGLEIKTDKPEEVGADRLVNAVAVAAHYQTPAIVVDFGTATTFDVIDENGAYLGGAIAPGVNLSLEALHSAAAKLPKISIQKPGNVIGQDTVSAMQSGIYWGYIGLIEGMVKRLSEEIGQEVFVIATGGLAALFAKGTKAIRATDENLTLKGLVHIYSQNTKAEAA